MKTTEQIVKALEHRIGKLETHMEQLESYMEDKPEVKNIYWSSYERHSELSGLLSYIKDEAAGCNTGGCGGCKTPCSAKNV